MIYLDYNATTPVDERVLNAMLPYFSEQFGNAASAHPYGFDANNAVKLVRTTIAKHLNCNEQEIIFTSGATESINLALKGVHEAYIEKGNHIITVATEHKAVLDTCHKLSEKGANITYLSVDEEGLINLDELKKSIQPSTILIAVMYANNETGVIQPIEAIGKIAKEHGIFFFCDATQAIGKCKVDVQAQNIDLLAFSGHKIYAPKGVGALYVRRKNPRINLAEQINGGGHERGWRSGTLNVPSTVALGKAITLFNEEENKQVKSLRNKLENAILKIPYTKLNGNKKNRLINTINISVADINGKMLIAELIKELAVSSGSACSSASVEPSHVLTAMGLSTMLVKNAIRISIGRFTTEKEINFAIHYIEKTINKLRTEYL